MDITLQCKRFQPPSSPRNEIGDIIKWHITENLLVNGTTPADLSDRFYWFFITQFPDVSAAQWERIRRKVTIQDHIDDLSRPVDPVTGLRETVLRNARLWHVPIGAVPPSIRAELRQHGYNLTEVTWAQAKARIRRKLELIQPDADPNGSGYDENQSVAITDEDVTAA